MLGNITNKPLQFVTEDCDNVNLVFEIFRSSATSDEGIQIIGTRVAPLKSLRQGLTSMRESPIRVYTSPILEDGPVTYISTGKFSILVITPFEPHCSPPKALPTKDSPSQIIVGHWSSLSRAFRALSVFESKCHNEVPMIACRLQEHQVK